MAAQEVLYEVKLECPTCAGSGCADCTGTGVIAVWVGNHEIDAAVRQAKLKAGLDPDQLYRPERFIESMEVKWRSPFWERQLDRVAESLGIEFR